MSGTRQAIIQTATALADGIEECPQGKPYGYGLLTPDPMWLYRCSHCLSGDDATVTPWPCPTPYVMNGAGECFLPTATPETTPTAGPTPTPGDADAIYQVPFDATVTGVYYYWDDYVIDFGTFGGPGNPVTGVQAEDHRNGNFCASQHNPCHIANVTVTVDVPSGCTLKSVAWDHKFRNSINSTITRVLQIYDTSSALIATPVNGNGTQDEDTWLGQLFSGTWADAGSFTVTLETHMSSPITSGGYIYLDNITFSCDGTPLTPTPTPVLTSTPGYAPDFDVNYCDVIDPASGPAYDGTMWGAAPGIVQMPNFSVGEPVCTTFYPYEFELNEYGFTTVEWPGLVLCIVPVTFGNLIILGLTVNLDLILGSFAGMTIIKWFWR